MTNPHKEISALFMSLRTRLARAVTHIVPPKEVEDIVQETYVRVCQVKKKDEIKDPGSFMLRIARNLALDHVKRAEYRLASLEVDGLELSRPYDDPMELAASDEAFAQFCEAVRQLPQQCRKAFVLKKVYGYSQKEIAQQMGISESTVEKHIGAGLQKCARSLRDMRKTDAKKAPAPWLAKNGDVS